MDLLTLVALPTAVGATEAVHQQRLLDYSAESPKRLREFHLDVYCDAKSRKRKEVHGSIVVLRGSKLCLWPQDPATGLPKCHPTTGETPHPFTGFYLPLPSSHPDSQRQPIPSARPFALLTTLSISSSPHHTKVKPKPKLHYTYAHASSRALHCGSYSAAQDHTLGPWDWTEEDEQGLMLGGGESLVARKEDDSEDGKGEWGSWGVYWDQDDDGLKCLLGRERGSVLRCSLERRLVEK